MENDILDLLRAHQTNVMQFLQGICTIIAFLTLITKNMSGTRKTAIFLLELNAAFSLEAVRFYYIYKDVADTSLWNAVRVAKFLDYLFIMTIILFLNLYLKDLFTHEGGLEKFPFRLYVTDIVLLTGIILLVISRFTSLYYTFDENNHYVHTKYYPVFYLFPLLALILQLSCIIHHYKKFTRSLRIPIVLFIIIPIFMSAAQYALTDLAPVVISIVGMAIVLYVFTIGEMNRTVEKAHRVEIEMLEKYRKELEQTVEERTQELRVANEKAEHLLLNILPENIARELAEEPGKTISKSYPNATVLFTDIVDFTSMTASMTAEETVKLLNTMTSLFDERAKKEGIEKIKTIGDAYMAASGLTENADNDGAERMIRFAKGILQDIETMNRSSERPIQVRIGVNSGELVAGVIGKIKFIYDIWGDTVNVASRMESTGEPMMIHISESTYERVKEHFDYKEKVSVEIKGKGMMSGYLL